MDGWVYIMSVAGVRPLKIGMTVRTPSARAADWGYTISPVKLRVLASWRCSDARRLERLTHKALAAGGYRRVAGEFYDCSLPAVQAELERVAEVHGIAVEPAGLSDD